MQESSPLFSVILPCYNRAALLANAIESVLAQSFHDFELIVVDDGSTDNTRQVVASFTDSRIRYFYKENEERSIARNFGISKARGSYVNFLDSDDFFYPHHLETIRHFLEDNPTARIVHSCFEIRNESNVVLRRSLFGKGSVQALIVENSFQCNAIFIAKEIVDRYTFLPDKRAVIAEDWYLWLVLASRFEIRWIDTVTCAVREHSTRSLNSLSPSRVSDSFTAIFEALERDNDFLRFYGRKAYLMFKAKNLCFTALITVLSKRKVDAGKLLVRAVKSEPRIVFSRSFLAVAKKIIFQ